jgi:hypothetical protein
VPESYQSARRLRAASHQRQASSDLAAVKRPGKMNQSRSSVHDNMPQGASRRNRRPESRRSPPAPDTRSETGCGQALDIIDRHWKYAERDRAAVWRELMLLAGFVAAVVAVLLTVAVSAALFVVLVMYAEHVTQVGSLSALVVLLGLTGGLGLARRRRRR